MNRLMRVLLCVAFTAVIGLFTVGMDAGETTRSIRVIYTNDLLGYLETCHCHANMQGGIAKRASLIASLIKENPNTVIVDSGNLCSTPGKLPLVASLITKMHYDAIGIGTYDWRMGDDFFKQTAKNKLTVLDTTPDAKSGTEPFVIKQIDGVNVGIVSFGASPSASGLSVVKSLSELSPRSKCHSRGCSSCRFFGRWLCWSG